MRAPSNPEPSATSPKSQKEAPDDEAQVFYSR